MLWPRKESRALHRVQGAEPENARVHPGEEMSVTTDAPSVAIVVFAVGGSRYGLSLAAAERVIPIVEIAPLPGAPDVALGIINVHGELVPVFDVRRRFGVPPCDFGVEAKLLLARSARRRVAIAVDEVFDP